MLQRGKEALHRKEWVVDVIRQLLGLGFVPEYFNPYVAHAFQIGVDAI